MVCETKKRLSGIYLIMGVAIMAAAICLFALIPRSADAADIAIDAGSTVLNLSATSIDEIIGQSDRFSVSGQGISVSGAAPITIKGDGTGSEWSVLIKEAKSITIEDDTKISNTFYALNIPEGATLNMGGNGVTITGRIISDSIYRRPSSRPTNTKGTISTTQDGTLSATDSSGNPVEGLVFSGSEYYFSKSDGTLATDEWVTWKGRTYFCGPDGAAVRNDWVEQDGNHYLTNKYGQVVRKIWTIDDGSWYWIKEDGIMAKDEEIIIDGKTYYFDANGVCSNMG